jgi:hypothetical protein
MLNFVFHFFSLACIIGDLHFRLKILQEEFEDTKGVIRIHKSKKNRQHNGQKRKYKRTNNDIQNTTQKTKDRVTRIPLKIRGELRGTPEG